MPDVQRQRRKAGNLAQGLPGLPRPRGRVPEPGDLLDLAAVLELPGLRDRDRESVPDVQRQRRPAQRPPAASQHSRRRARRQPHPARRQGRAGSPWRRARGSVRDHPRPGVARVQAHRREPRGRGPADDSRGDPGGRDRGSDAERVKAPAGSARNQARNGPAAAWRRTATTRRQGPRRHPLSVRDRRTVVALA